MKKFAVLVSKDDPALAVLVAVGGKGERQQRACGYVDIEALPADAMAVAIPAHNAVVSAAAATFGPRSVPGLIAEEAEVEVEVDAEIDAEEADAEEADADADADADAEVEAPRAAAKQRGGKKKS